MKESMKKFEQGVLHLDIVSAVTQDELTDVNEVNDEYKQLSKVKFIPASGAATRMFKDLYAYLEDQKETDFVRHFFEHLDEFAFYEDLTKYLDMDALDLKRAEDRVVIIQTLLDEKMDYGNLPKALLKFHEYENGTKTPIDEHIYEGERYLDADKVNLHFTISPQHEDEFNAYVKKALADKEHVNITYSFQKDTTNTPAATMDNKPFELEDGEVLYRPGGHGALIENLNDLDADVVFIKNVDNVCHQSQVEDTIESKRMLASIGWEVKQQIDTYVNELLDNHYDLDEISAFIEDVLNITFKSEWTKEAALKFLNRPLRVAGVVRNQGDPGGGPYVVDNGTYTDLQICETSEIDMNDPQQVEILNNGEYFNPVDLVCFLKDENGYKFNLLDYTNEDRYFISEKSHEGRALKALEHPGLWNGAMHNWNTLFVEVPLSTFNPVKNVNDLLKKGHRNLKASPIK